MNSMLTLEEVQSFLDVDPRQIEKYIEFGKLHAYKIGGTYIRFRKEEVLNLKSGLQNKTQKTKVPITSRALDFWRFNNFYIISIVVVALLVAFFFKS